MAEIGNSEKRDIERFLYNEAELLDHRKFDDWLKLFTDNGWYWLPIKADQESPLDTVSIIYDDRKLLETRVRRLNNVNIHAESPPPRTSRILGNIRVEDRNPETGAISVMSRFQLVEFRGERQRIFAGSMQHSLVQVSTGFAIEGKRVDLVNAEGMLEGITTLL